MLPMVRSTQRQALNCIFSSLSQQHLLQGEVHPLTNHLLLHHIKVLDSPVINQSLEQESL